MSEVSAQPVCPLSPESLSPSILRATQAQAPAAVRMMAARGMAPMAPKDLVTAQFVLTFDADEKIRAAADKSLRSLDERIANAVLGDSTTHPLVLGHLLQAQALNDHFAEKLLLNPSTPASAIVGIGEIVSEKTCAIIANNQSRLLEQPEIARALSKNPQALRSTIDRVVDFLVRSSVFLEGVTQFEEALLRLTGEERLQAAHRVALEPELIDMQYLSPAQKEELKAQGRQLIAEEPEESLESDELTNLTVEQKMRNMNIGQLVAVATKGKKEYRRYLLRHSNRIIALAAITSPATKDNDIIAAAQSRLVHADVINFIANKKDWVRLYAVKHALAQNPKTLLPTAMKLTTLLTKKDLRMLCKSRNIPTAIRNLAGKLSKQAD